MDGEAGPSRPAVALDRSLVLLDEALRQRQPETATFRLYRRPTIKSFDEPWQFFGLDARPIVADAHHQASCFTPKKYRKGTSKQ